MSETRNCPICNAVLSSWAEMTSDTGVSLAATCPRCTTFVVPEDMMGKLADLDEDARWDVCARVSIEFKTTGQPVVITDEHIEG
jgi:hypothetical protein